MQVGRYNLDPDFTHYYWIGSPVCGYFDCYIIFSDFVEDDINYLMGIALDKIVFLPFGKLMDDFRWALFAGEIGETDLNAGWWSRRYKKTLSILMLSFILTILCCYY